MIARQTGIVAAMLLFDSAKQQTSAKLVARYQFHLFVRSARHRVAQVQRVFEPFDLNWWLAIENLAHEHEAHA